MNLFIKLIIKPLRSLLKLLFNRIFYVALALVVQLAWLLIALFRLMEYSRWVTIGMQVIGFLVVLWIVNKKINPSYKLAWTMLILIFPVFGVSLYLLFGKSRIGAVMEQHYQNLIDETAEYLEGSELTRKRLNEDDRSMRIQSDYIWQYSRYPVHENTTAEYFQVGDDMFPVLVHELEQAKHFIFIEYFIINDGVMWQTILNILEKKAKEGVDVRLIYDGFGCLTTLPYKYDQEMRRRGIKCEVFNRFRPILNIIQNNRDHRKICVIDGWTGFQFNPKETYGERIDRVTYRAQAQGAMRKADGTARTETDQKVICLEDEEEKYRIEFADKAAKGITDEKQAQAAAEIFSGQWVESKNKWGKKCQAFVVAKEDRDRYVERSVMVNMALLKKTWAEKAMTGAKLRVIRALLGVKGTYTKAELLKNFAIPTVIFSPDFSDPQVRQAMLTQGMNSVNNMFGTSQIAVKSVDFESESTVFTQDDLDNPAYASDTEIENDYPPMQEPDVVPEPEPEPEPDRSADFQCSRCGEVINERVYEYSINKFGEPLCIKCQRGGGRR